MHKQSTRRMIVAQKRQQEYQDVLRRRRTYSRQQWWFWDWFSKAGNEIFLHSYDRSRPFQEIGLRGILPEYRAIIVRISWVADHWLVVSDEPYHAYAVGPTINKAIARFRDLMQEFVV